MTARPPGALITVAAIWVATVAALVAVGWLYVSDRDRDQLAARLQLAELTAAHADRILAEAIHEVDLMATNLVGFDLPLDDTESAIPLRGTYARHASFSSGVLMVDDQLEVIFGEPDWLTHWPDRGGAARAIAAAGAHPVVAVSEPFVEPFTGHVVTALSVPVFADDGSRAATVIGLLDLSDPLITDLIEPARRLGPTGHADLIEESGIVLASTNPDHVMGKGDHPDFYERMAATSRPTVEVVPHVTDSGEERTPHLMSYAPLRNAAWGIALGAEEPAGAARDRATLIAIAVAGSLLAAAVAVATGRRGAGAER